MQAPHLTTTPSNTFYTVDPPLFNVMFWFQAFGHLTVSHSFNCENSKSYKSFFIYSHLDCKPQYIAAAEAIVHSLLFLQLEQ